MFHLCSNNKNPFFNNRYLLKNEYFICDLSCGVEIHSLLTIGSFINYIYTNVYRIGEIESFAKNNHLIKESPFFEL